MEQLQEYLEEEGIQEILEMLGLDSEEDFRIELLVEFLEDQNQLIVEAAEDALHEYINILREDNYEDVLIKLDYDDVVSFCSAKRLHICSDRWFWISYAKRRYGFDIENTEKYNLHWLKKAVKVISESKKDFPLYAEKYQLLLDEYVDVVIKLDNLKRLNFVFRIIKNYRKNIYKDPSAALFKQRSDLNIIYMYLYDTILELDPKFGIEEYETPNLYIESPIDQFSYLIISLIKDLNDTDVKEYVEELYDILYTQVLESPYYEESLYEHINEIIISNTDLSILEYFNLYVNKIEIFNESIWFYVQSKLDMEQWTRKDINNQLKEIRNYFNEISFKDINNWDYISWEQHGVFGPNIIGFRGDKFFY